MRRIAHMRIVVDFDWLWELDRKLNSAAMDAMIAVLAAATISQTLRFVIEHVLS